MYERIMTLDIECLIIQGEFIPYVCGIQVNKNEFKSFYGENCVQNMLIYVVSQKKDKTIYVHNLDKFDKCFILKLAIQLDYNIDVVPGAGGGQNSITSFTIKYVNKTKIVKVVFMDSQKILPQSQKKLGVSFNIEEGKLDFPYKFMDSCDVLYWRQTFIH